MISYDRFRIVVSLRKNWNLIPFRIFLFSNQDWISSDAALFFAIKHCQIHRYKRNMAALDCSISMLLFLFSVTWLEWMRSKIKKMNCYIFIKLFYYLLYYQTCRFETSKDYRTLTSSRLEQIIFFDFRSRNTWIWLEIQKVNYYTSSIIGSPDFKLHWFIINWRMLHDCTMSVSSSHVTQKWN